MSKQQGSENMSTNLPTIYQDEIDYIERRHESFNLKIANAVEDAIQAGAALIDLKAKCKHGEFTKLVTERTSLSMKTAQRYMNAYNNREQLLERGVDPEVIQQMSLTALVDLNRKPKVKADPESDARVMELAAKFNESHSEFIATAIRQNQAMLKIAREIKPDLLAEFERVNQLRIEAGESEVFDHSSTHFALVRELVDNPDLYTEEGAATDPNWTAKAAFNARIAHHSFLWWFLQLDGEGLLCKSEITDHGERIARNMTPAEIMDFGRVELVNGEMLEIFHADGGKFDDFSRALSDEAMGAVNAIYDRGLLAA
jgi:hypothetical protein